MSDATANTYPGAGGNSGETLAPIDSSKRIGVLDVLRGFALIGIVLMNIEWFGRYLNDLGSFDTSLTGIDHATGWLVRCLVEGKFYKMFALLFGMGFAVMLMRAREKGRPFGAWFTRRMLVLFAIGVLHMIFLWGGDILHDYAFAGLLLLGYVLLLRTRRLQRFDNPRSILKLALGWMAFPFIASAAVALVYSTITDHGELQDSWAADLSIQAAVEERLAIAPLPAEDPAATSGADDADDEGRDTAEQSGLTGDEEIGDEELREQRVAEIVERRRESRATEEKEIDAFTNGSYWEATRYRTEFFTVKILNTPFFSLFLLMPIFLLGYWFIASGVIRHPEQHLTLFRSMAWLGLPFGLALNIGGLVITQHPVGEISNVVRGTSETIFFLGQYVLCAGYIGMIVLALQSPRWSRWLGGLAPMGRMALTNYIAQSVILTSIFYGYAGGLYGEVGRGAQMLIVFAIVVFQVMFSRWWLNRFRFGPLEWLWRTLTYKSLQPMRI